MKPNSTEARLRKEMQMITNRQRFPRESSLQYRQSKYGFNLHQTSSSHKSKTENSQMETMPTRNMIRPKIRYKNDMVSNLVSTGLRRSKSSGSLLEMTSSELTKMLSKGKIHKEINKFEEIGQIRKEKYFQKALLQAVENGRNQEMEHWLSGQEETRGKFFKRDSSAVRKNNTMNKLKLSSIFEVDAQDVTSQRKQIKEFFGHF
jgi:hypothetical protein